MWEFSVLIWVHTMLPLEASYPSLLCRYVWLCDLAFTGKGVKESRGASHACGRIGTRRPSLEDCQHGVWTTSSNITDHQAEPWGPLQTDDTKLGNSRWAGGGGHSAGECEPLLLDTVGFPKRGKGRSTQRSLVKEEQPEDQRSPVRMWGHAD